MSAAPAQAGDIAGDSAGSDAPSASTNDNRLKGRAQAAMGLSSSSVRQGYAQPLLNIKTTRRARTGLRRVGRGMVPMDFGAADRRQGDRNAPSPSLHSPRRHSGRAAAIQRRSR